ncbi:MAG: rhodanese-like domain-containing protein [Methylococcaceae bacterium]
MNVTLDRLLEFVSNHWMMASGLFIAIILLVQDVFDSAFRKHKMVSSSEAVTLMNDDATVVIDVREAHEFSAGHISNARHIPLGKLDEQAFEIDGYKNQPVLIVCQVGTRSGAACKKLAKRGFTQLHELKGGVQAWQEDKLPLTKKSGK